jgi:hypothetical protein
MKNFVIAVIALAACSKSSKQESASPAVAIDAAAVNALVPAELKATLVFDKTDVVEERGKDKLTFTVAAPKGWKQDNKMFAELKGGNDVGFMTSMHLASDCDGTCEPKDWAKSADKTVFDQFKDAGVIKTDTTPTSRLLIAMRDKTTFVAYAWWQPDARHYHFCLVTLEEPVAAAAPAFAKACQAVGIAGEH